MTDDRDQSWKQFATRGDEAAGEAESAPQALDIEAARQQLLRRIDRREDVLDRTVKEFDEVIDHLRGAAAARTSQEPKREEASAPLASERRAAAPTEVTQQTRTPPLTADNANTAKIVPGPQGGDAGQRAPVQEARKPEPRFEKPAAEPGPKSRTRLRDREWW